MSRAPPAHAAWSRSWRGTYCTSDAVSCRYDDEDDEEEDENVVEEKDGEEEEKRKPEEAAALPGSRVAPPSSCRNRSSTPGAWDVPPHNTTRLARRCRFERMALRVLTSFAVNSDVGAADEEDM